MAGMLTGMVHFVFGKPGPRRPAKAKSNDLAAAAAAEESPADARAPDAPAPAILNPPAEPSPAPPEAAAPIPEDPAPADTAPGAPTTPAPEAAPPSDAPPASIEAEAADPPPAESPADAPPPPAESAPPTPPAVEPAPDAPARLDPGMRLSAHFTLEEFTHSDTAKREKILNLPTPEHLENLRVAAQGMERVRAILGNQPIRITSGYRTKELNTKISGSSASSDHMEGFSVDFWRPGMSHYEVAETLSKDEALMAGVDQLIYEKARWVHISFAPRRKRELLTAYERAETGKRTHYKTGLHVLDENGRLPQG